MPKLLPGLAIGVSLVAFPLASLVLPALAQDEQATVTIDGAFAEALSTATGIPVDDLPDSLSVPVAVAATVCGTAVSAGDTCVGTSSPESLSEFLDDDDSESSSSESSVSSSEPESSSEEPDNSAKAFAPGQLKGDGESAKAYAPGHLKGDGETGRDHAPGHIKKNKGD